MLGKLKHVLGIEGVKVELLLDDQKKKLTQKVSGTLVFTTKSKGTVNGITVKIMEKYSRGRGKSKLVDEFPIGILEIEDEFTIKPEETIEIPFNMTYERVYSEMDKLQQGNFFVGPLISIAKKLKSVSSTFYVLVEANVKGTTLNPFDKKDVKLK